MRGVPRQKHVPDAKRWNTATAHYEIASPRHTAHAGRQLRVCSERLPINSHHIIRRSGAGRFVWILFRLQYRKEHQRPVEWQCKRKALRPEQRVDISEHYRVLYIQLGGNPSLGIILADHTHPAGRTHRTLCSVRSHQITTAQFRLAARGLDTYGNAINLRQKPGEAGRRLHLDPAGQQLLRENPLRLPLLQVLLRGIR